MSYRILPKNAITHLKQAMIAAENDHSQEFQCAGGLTDDHINLIRSELSGDREGWPIDALLRLRKIVDVATQVEMLTSNYQYALWKIWEIMRSASYIKPVDDQKSWTTALRIILRYYNYNDNLEIPREKMSRESKQANSLKELRKKGFDIVLDGHGIRLGDKSFSCACKALSRVIREVGGIHVASCLLKVMKIDMRIYSGSLIHARRLTNLYNHTETVTPWHFLYTLALKNFESRPLIFDATVLMEEMERLAKAIVSSIDLQPYSIYENMHMLNASIEGMLYESNLYDDLVSFPQWNGVVAQDLCLDMLESMNENECISSRIDIEKLSIFIKILIKKSKIDDFALFQPADLVVHGLSTGEAEFCCRIFSINSVEINQNFNLPSDAKHRNHTKFPLIKRSENNYLVQPTSVSARAFYECSYNQAKKELGNVVDTKFGKVLESINLKSLSRNRVNVTGSKLFYRGERKGIDYEIDIIAENDDSIFLFECKKNRLIVESRVGNTLRTLNDVKSSFLFMPKQLCRHEHFLRAREVLEFKNGYRLYLNGRRVEKIAVSLSDHGSLQARSFTVPFIKKMAISRLSASDPRALPIIDEFNEELHEFQSYLTWVKSAEDPNHELQKLAISTWWMSIDQLEYALRETGSLADAFKMIRNVTARSGDFIEEFERARNLNEVGIALRDVSEKMEAQAII